MEFERLTRRHAIKDGIKIVSLGCKSPQLKHIVYHHRQVFMVLRHPPSALVAPEAAAALTPVAPVVTALATSDNPGPAIVDVSALSGQIEEVDTQQSKYKQSECKNRVSVFNGELSVCEEVMEDANMSDDDYLKYHTRGKFQSWPRTAARPSIEEVPTLQTQRTNSHRLSRV